jgi:hypothetical protein
MTLRDSLGLGVKMYNTHIKRREEKRREEKLRA